MEVPAASIVTGSQLMIKIPGRDTERREGGNVTTDGETGMMWPQAKEHLEPPEAERDEEWTLPWSLQRECGLPTP